MGPLTLSGGLDCLFARCFRLPDPPPALRMKCAAIWFGDSIRPDKLPICCDVKFYKQSLCLLEYTFMNNKKSGENKSFFHPQKSEKILRMFAYFY